MKDAAKRGMAATKAKAAAALLAPVRRTRPRSEWWAPKMAAQIGPRPRPDRDKRAEPRLWYQQSVAQLLPSAMIAAQPAHAGTTLAARRESKLAAKHSPLAEDEMGRAVDGRWIIVLLRRQFSVLATNAVRAGKMPRSSQPKRGKAGMRPNGSERCSHWREEGGHQQRDSLATAAAKSGGNFAHVFVPSSARLRERGGRAQAARRTDPRGVCAGCDERSERGGINPGPD
jgi:hypothetical protein